MVSHSLNEDQCQSNEQRTKKARTGCGPILSVRIPLTKQSKELLNQNDTNKQHIRNNCDHGDMGMRDMVLSS